MRMLMLGMAVVTCCLSATGTEAQAPRPDPITRIVTVDGRPMRVQTAGLEARKPGEPLVVFESGGLSHLGAWSEVLPRVAAFAPVFAYDRSGEGESEWDGHLPTPSHVASKLNALLQTIGAGPPYVLVGWSWGGHLIRHYAGLHPGNVAGLVYVDPAIKSPARELALLREIGAPEGAYEAYLDLLESIGPELPFPPGAKAEGEVINQLYRRRIEPDFGPVPVVPTAVLLAGKYEPPHPQQLALEAGRFPYDRVAYHHANLRDRANWMQEWVTAAPGGLFAIAMNSGHAIQRQDPDLVVHAIRSVLPPPADGTSRDTLTVAGTSGNDVPKALVSASFRSVTVRTTSLRR